MYFELIQLLSFDFCGTRPSSFFPEVLHPTESFTGATLKQSDILTKSLFPEPEVYLG